MVKQIVFIGVVFFCITASAMSDEKLARCEPQKRAQKLLGYVADQSFEQAAQTIQQFPKTVARINDKAHWRFPSFPCASEIQNTATYEDAVLLFCQLPLDLQRRVVSHLCLDENTLNNDIINTWSSFFSLKVAKAFKRYARCVQEKDAVLCDKFSLPVRLSLSRKHTTLMRRMIFNHSDGNGETHYTTFEERANAATHCTFLSSHEKELLATLPQKFIDADEQYPRLLEDLMVCERPSMLSKAWKIPFTFFLHQGRDCAKGPALNDLTFKDKLFGSQGLLLIGLCVVERIIPNTAYIMNAVGCPLNLSQSPIAGYCAKESHFNINYMDNYDQYVVPYSAKTFLNKYALVAALCAILDIGLYRFGSLRFSWPRTLITRTVFSIPAMLYDAYNSKAVYEIKPISAKAFWEAAQAKKKQHSKWCTLL